MMQHELRMAQLAAENKEKLEREHMNKMKRERARKRRIDEAAALRRAKEFGQSESYRRGGTETERTSTKAVPGRAELKRKQMAESRRMKKEAARKEAEIREKRKRTEEETARILNEQRQLAIQKLKEMEERDIARRKAMEDSRLEAKRIAMAKKSQSEKLIREAQAAANSKSWMPNGSTIKNCRLISGESKRNCKRRRNGKNECNALARRRSKKRKNKRT